MTVTVRTTFAVVLVATAVAVFRPSSVETQSPVVNQRLATLEAQVAALQSQVTALQAAKATLEGQLNAEATARTAADTALQTQIANMPPVPQNLLDLADYVSVDLSTINELVGPHVIFSGANVHVRNGSTPSPTNGLGNLIVGFNSTEGGSSRAGSHNIVVGEGHTYSSHGGLVAGWYNTIRAPYATVTGGVNNRATAWSSSVCGGDDNSARGGWSTVCGGVGNIASGDRSTISGGSTNYAIGHVSSVFGGGGNEARADGSTLCGGGGIVVEAPRSQVP